jgi:hypothetical protein
VRAYATAFLVATAAALVVDAALQLALDAVRVSAYGGAPWWVTAHLVERGRWVALALLLWWVGPRLFATERVVNNQAGVAGDPWRQVAVAVIALPLLWIAATWLVSALRFTLLASWDTDGRVFLSGDYYRGLLLDLAPWMLAAAVVRAVSRHMPDT